MPKIMRDSIRTRLMIARSYAEQGWPELAQVQLQLIKKEIATWEKEKTVVLKVA